MYLDIYDEEEFKVIRLGLTTEEEIDLRERQGRKEDIYV